MGHEEARRVWAGAYCASLQGLRSGGRLGTVELHATAQVDANKALEAFYERFHGDEGMFAGEAG